MSVVHVSTQIDAPPQAVFDLVMDPRRLGDWVTIHRSVSNLSADPTAPGAKMDQTLHMRGVSFKVHWTLVNVQAPFRAEWQGRGPAHSRAAIVYSLKGEPGGPTTFDYLNDFGAPGGMLGSVASRVLVGHASEREAHNSLQRLKALMEHT
jgi:uncharacterized protein YndB with AHSA1/START domain